jgi:GNAT superfamily N-acetyltransferase
MDIKVRQATIRDYKELCEIYEELDELHRVNHPELFIKPEGYARTKDYILEIIQDINKTLFVAEIESRIIGLAECYVVESRNFPLLKKRKWIQLDNIVIRRNYQKQNIGTLLLKKVVEWAKSKKIKRIELKVYSFNSAAIDFYLKNGFKEFSKSMYLEL